MLEKKLVSFPRKIKRLIVVVNDYLIIFFAMFFSISFIGNDFYTFGLILSMPLLVIVIFTFFNIYDNVIKHINFELIIKINLILFFSHLLFLILYNFIFDNQLPIQVISSSFFTSAFLIYFSRVIAKYILYKNKDVNFMENVAVYLNKDDNENIVSIINDNDLFNIVAIISSEKEYIGLYVKGVKVVSDTEISSIVLSKKIKKLFIPSKLYSQKVKNDIYKVILDSPLKIVEIPDIQEIVSGKDDLNILKNLSIEDIVDRSLKDNTVVDNKFFESKTVLVTGGGGSIGSILCEKIINNAPSKLIILDNSEYALFQVAQKLKNKFPESKIESCLLDLKDNMLLDRYFEKNKIDIIYHAAAYKHVDLVEKNIESGIKNNIISFINLLEVSIKNKIKNITLVSTDKAVSPTTVMGMTKRVCEMILFNEITQNNDLNFSVVRFGNVFNSSGSVISIFKNQLQKGQDLTLTDPKVTRYFMSIKEAANLVIKSSMISRGGELFILDMGEPLKILDIAKKMIHLSGKTIKSDLNPEGDIAIKITGLLPSEKLHEELSQTNLSETIENKIYLSDDLSKDLRNFDRKIEDLLDEKNNKEQLFKKLQDLANS